MLRKRKIYNFYWIETLYFLNYFFEQTDIGAADETWEDTQVETQNGDLIITSSLSAWALTFTGVSSDFQQG